MRTIIVIVLFIVALVILRLTLFSGNDVEKSGGQSSRPAIPVTAIVAESAPLEKNIIANGSLMAYESVELMPEASGRIVELNIQEGQKVQKGQLLLKLNDQELVANLMKSEAMLRLQKEQLNRQDELIKIQGISTEERDKTQQALDAASADVEYYRALINKTEIRAPFSGILGFKHVSEGAYVAPGTSICKLYQTNKLKLEFSIPERYSSQVKLPMDVLFTLQGSTEKYKAKVYALEPGIDIQTRSVSLRASVENDNASLLPGRFADISVPLSTNLSAIMVPTQCIIPVLKGQKVWLSVNGKAISKEVQVGFRNDKEIEVVSGIDSGDTVLTSGIMSIKEGADIRISKLKKKSDR